MNSYRLCSTSGRVDAMERIMSSRAVGITLCVIGAIGATLGLIQIVRGVNLGSSISLTVIEIGALILGMRIIRRAAQLEAPDPDSTRPS